MTLNPVFAREFRVASRAPTTYKSRAGTSMISVAWVGIAMVLAGRFGVPLSFREVVESAGMLGGTWCLFAGFMSTMDSISAERREGTLGFLMTTRLTPFQVVIGKVLAAGIQGVSGVVASVPAVFIAVLAGGVGGGELLRLSLALVNSLLFGMAVGCVVSVVFHEPRKWAGPLVGLLAAGMYGLPNLRGAPGSPWALIAEACGWFLPQAVVSQAMSISPMIIHRFWLHLGFSMLVGLSLVVVAGLLLARGWRDRPPKRDRVGFRARWDLWLKGGRELRQAHRVRALGVTPYYWIASREVRAWAVPWCWLLVVFLAIGLVFVYNPGAPVSRLLPALVLGFFAVHFTLKTGVAGDVAYLVYGDRMSGAFELLLTTPLSPVEIVRGIQRAMVRKHGAPVVLLLLITFVVCLAMSEAWFSGLNASAPLLALLAWGAYATTVLLDCHALVLVSIRMALKMPALNQCASTALSQVVFLPALAVLSGLVLWMWLLETEIPSFVATVTWFVVGIGASVGFVRFGRRDLVLRFKQRLLEGVMPAGGGWGRTLGLWVAAVRRRWAGRGDVRKVEGEG